MERRSFGKSLTAILARTVISGAVAFPLYAMFSSSVQNKGFAQSLTDEKTAIFAGGFAMGGLVYGLGKEIYRAYKNK